MGRAFEDTNEKPYPMSVIRAYRSIEELLETISPASDSSTTVEIMMRLYVLGSLKLPAGVANAVHFLAPPGYDAVVPQATALTQFTYGARKTLSTKSFNTLMAMARISHYHKIKIATESYFTTDAILADHERIISPHHVTILNYTEARDASYLKTLLDLIVRSVSNGKTHGLVLASTMFSVQKKLLHDEEPVLLRCLTATTPIEIDDLVRDHRTTTISLSTSFATMVSSLKVALIDQMTTAGKYAHIREMSHRGEGRANITNALSILKVAAPVSTGAMSGYVGFDSRHFEKVEIGDLRPDDLILFGGSRTLDGGQLYSMLESVKTVVIKVRPNDTGFYKARNLKGSTELTLKNSFTDAQVEKLPGSTLISLLIKVHEVKAASSAPPTRAKEPGEVYEEDSDYEC